jgi:2-dehydropantoate 2-reductase
MNIAILGAGALGGLFGGYLSQTDHTVHLIDIWEEHVQAIADRGLRTDRPNRDVLTVQPQATTNPSTVENVDIVFVFVKAIHTETAVRDAAPVLTEDTILVTLQNGLGLMEEIQELRPENTVVGGTTYVAANLEGPGHIVQTGPLGNSTVGGADECAVNRVATVLSDAGFPVTMVDDPEPHIWNKQLIGLGTKPVSALTGMDTQSLGNTDYAVVVIEELIAEGIRIAEAKGVTIEGDPKSKFHDIIDQFSGTPTKSSMLEDIEHHRETEVSYLNEKIVQYGDELDIDTPYNLMATALMKTKEKSYLDN